jgi:hypothetical protein
MGRIGLGGPGHFWLGHRAVWPGSSGSHCRRELGLIVGLGPVHGEDFKSFFDFKNVLNAVQTFKLHRKFIPCPKSMKRVLLFM